MIRNHGISLFPAENAFNLGAWESSRYGVDYGIELAKNKRHEAMGAALMEE